MSWEINHDWCIGKDLKGGGHGLFQDIHLS